MTTPTPTTVQVKIQLRRDTAATWASVNPVLLAGEAGLETDTNKIKIGNGSTAWNSLGYFPFVVNGGTVTGNLEIGTTGTLTFEGSSADNFETTLGVVNPTADRTINLPNVSGTIITTGDSGTVTSTMIADGTIVDADVSATAEIAVSKLADGAARQLLQTDAAGTGVEWTSNIDIPGTLDVTGAATFDGKLTVVSAVAGGTNYTNEQVSIFNSQTGVAGNQATLGFHLNNANWGSATTFARVSAVLENGTTGATSLAFGTAADGSLATPNERARIDSSGRLLVGTSSNDSNALAVIQGYAGLASGQGVLALRLGTTRPAGADTGIGSIRFESTSNTSSNYHYASISAFSDGASSSDTDIPGRLVFSTTADGASSPTERMRITSAGNVGIGKTSTKYKLDASEARIGTGYVVYSANTTKTASTTHTATITFESQGSAWEPKHVEIMFAGSLGSSGTAHAGIARYMFTTITSIGTVTELEDSGNGVSFAATTSGMDLVITATTTANNSYIGFSARITCGGSGGGFPTGMVIA